MKKNSEIQKLSLFNGPVEGSTREVVKVSLGENSYEIFIESGLLKKIGSLWGNLKLPGGVVVVTSPALKKSYGRQLAESLRKAGVEVFFIDIPPGEKYKTLETASKIYDALVNLKIERGDAIAVLGGGVLGDLAGFVAATYLRGVNFIQIPTTLLAQVDSSIGGKVGVNHPRGKNLIGAFYQPKAVFIDLSALESLPLKEIRQGLAEVVKYGLIWDKGFFEFLEKVSAELNSRLNFSENKIQESIFKKIVSTSCRVKAAVVEKDEKEKNLRMILNFGHTVGHAIEAAGNFSRYSHGEAISLGMLAATFISLKLNLIKEEIYQRLKNLLKTLGLPIVIEGLEVNEILKPLELDKKVKEKKIRFILPEAIGQVGIYDSVDTALIKQAIKEHLV